MLGGVGEDRPWDLRRLTVGGEGIERAFARLDEADRFTAAHGQVVTARLIDQSQPGGHRTYIAARQLITIAMDHHRALLAVMSQSASPCAAWTLLRSVFESSALATWVLDPPTASSGGGGRSAAPVSISGSNGTIRRPCAAR